MKDEPEILIKGTVAIILLGMPRNPMVRAMQFKSSVLPTIEVLEADGAVCISFRKKKLEGHAPAESDGNKNLGSKLNLKA